MSRAYDGPTPTAGIALREQQYDDQVAHLRKEREMRNSAASG